MQSVYMQKKEEEGSVKKFFLHGTELDITTTCEDEKKVHYYYYYYLQLQLLISEQNCKEA